MVSRIGMPMTLRLRRAGSGLFWSVPAGPLVQAICPHSASAHGAMRMTAVWSATSQSPVGSAANAGLLKPALTIKPVLTIMISQDFAILFSLWPILYVVASLQD